MRARREIVAQAGRKGAVTIATNMAGRGTDILLGGNPEAMARDWLRKQNIAPEAATLEQYRDAVARFQPMVQSEHDEVITLGGLHIIGTERHESRRIDNQLRGRAGRQGDPGSSRFYLSLEDDLMRIFASERLSNVMKRLGMEEGVPIESKLISKRIEAAQRAVEGRNFEARKHVLEYDDVMNKQRNAVYGLRRQILDNADQKEYVLGIVDDLVLEMVEQHCARDIHPDEWNITGLRNGLMGQFGLDLHTEGIDTTQLNTDELNDALAERLHQKYEEKETLLTSEVMRWHERMILMQVVDQNWKLHLLTMDDLKEGIGLRGYGQKDPLVEYKKESYKMFQDMMNRIDQEALRFLFLMQPVQEEEQVKEIERRQRKQQAEMILRGAGRRFRRGRRQDRRPHQAEDRPQRALPLRQRQEVQEMLRRRSVQPPRQPSQRPARLFGWLFPDFGGLDAFNHLDTVLDSVVGISGLLIGSFALSNSAT